MQGFDKGGASFTRLEGCWYDSGSIFFTSTDGRTAGEGQVWQYDPRREELTLIFESPEQAVLDNRTILPSARVAASFCARTAIASGSDL
jgi:hypothetical protein